MTDNQDLEDLEQEKQRLELQIEVNDLRNKKLRSEIGVLQKKEKLENLRLAGESELAFFSIPEFSELPNHAQRIGKKIQDKFGVDGDSFTISEIAELNSSFSHGTIRYYFTQHFEDRGFIECVGKEEQENLWKWVKDWRKSEVVE